MGPSGEMMGRDSAQVRLPPQCLGSNPRSTSSWLWDLSNLLNNLPLPVSTPEKMETVCVWGGVWHRPSFACATHTLLSPSAHAYAAQASRVWRGC